MTQPPDDRPENEAPQPDRPEPKATIAFEDEIRLATVFGFAAGLFAGAVLAWVMTRRR
jgi:hypothetical protein